MSAIAPLEKLIEGLEQLAESGIDDITTEMAAAYQEVVDDQYAEGKGPHGETWAPLKRNGRPSHLQDTTTMSGESKAVNGVSGVTVRIPSPANFHQDGTSRMVARKLVPEDGTLPGRWGQVASETATAVIVGALKG